MKQGVTDDVVAWRFTFVANEYNEITSEARKIQPETTLIWFAFLWIGLGWQWIAQTNPDFEEENNPLVPFNIYLKFFLAAFLFTCIASTQYLLFLFTSSCVGETAIQRFVDLCTLANCSFLCMQNNYHGFYIHGKAPW